jgi:ubiquitin-like protein ATG12
MAAKAEKVQVQLMPVGSAPRLKVTTFKINANKPFLYIIDWLRKALKRDTIFLYCNSSFSPSPDILVADLFRCFKVGDKLIINYCDTNAYG